MIDVRVTSLSLVLHFVLAEFAPELVEGGIVRAMLADTAVPRFRVVPLLGSAQRQNLAVGISPPFCPRPGGVQYIPSERNYGALGRTV